MNRISGIEDHGGRTPIVQSFQGLTHPGYVLPPPSGADTGVRGAVGLPIIPIIPGADAPWLRAVAPLRGLMSVWAGRLGLPSFQSFQGLTHPGYVLPPPFGG